MAGALGRHLIFDVDRGDAGAVEFLDRAKDVDGVAVAGFGVADDGNVDRVDDFARLVDHFGQREQAGVGETERTMLSAAGDMHERKAQPLDQPGLNAVVAARRQMAGRLLHHRLQVLCVFHLRSLPCSFFLSCVLVCRFDSWPFSAHRRGRIHRCGRRWLSTVPAELSWRRPALRRRSPSAPLLRRSNSRAPRRRDWRRRRARRDFPAARLWYFSSRSGRRRCSTIDSPEPRGPYFANGTPSAISLRTSAS